MNVSRRAFTAGLGAASLLRARPAEAQPADTQGSTPPTDSSQTAPIAPPRPKLFDDHELATVAAIAEVIIPATDTPGAREAHVAEYLDLILSDSTEATRTAFLEGLWWTDGYCQRSAHAPFKDLSNADQLRIVSQLHDSADDADHTGRAFIRSMKAWTARLYYSTQVGEQELNKNGRVPATYFRPCESQP